MTLESTAAEHYPVRYVIGSSMAVVMLLIAIVTFVAWTAVGDTPSSDAQELVSTPQEKAAIVGTGLVGILFVGGLGIASLRQVSQASADHEAPPSANNTNLVGSLAGSQLQLGVATVLDRILAELQHIVPHDSASVFLLEERELRVVAHRGMQTDATGHALEIDRARAAREVVTLGRPLVINDTASDIRWGQLSDGEIAAWMGLPLRMRDEVVGLLNINSRTPNHFGDEAVELALAFADQASVALQNARLHALEIRQFEQDLLVARDIQASLLPSTPPPIPQLQIAIHSTPAHQVSGDYFQFLPLPDGRVGFAVGDVQGKGIPAALMMAVITSAIRDEAIRHTDSASLLQTLNARLMDRLRENQMNTALMVAIYDPATHHLEVANGGMVQPYLRKPNDAAFDFIPVRGYPLGMSDTIKYAAQSVLFEPGSLLIIMSDGILEAQNETGEFLGFDRIEFLLNDLPPDVTAEATMQQVLTKLHEHIGDAALQDDSTLLVLRAVEKPTSPATKTPPAQPVKTDKLPPLDTHARPDLAGIIDTPTQAHSESGDAPPHKYIELHLPSKLGFEKIARSTAEALARELGFADDKIEDIKTVVAEACMNAIEHGNQEVPDDPVHIRMSADNTKLEIRVTDRGKQAFPPSLPEPGQGNMRGWGLYLMEKLTDALEIKRLPEGGNQVQIIYYLHIQ